MGRQNRGRGVLEGVPPGVSGPLGPLASDAGVHCLAPHEDLGSVDAAWGPAEALSLAVVLLGTSQAWAEELLTLSC